MLTHSRQPPQVPFQEITEFIQQLVSIPSVESEQAIATCIAQKLTELGFESYLIGESEHPSVICHHQAATATKTIWLQSHLDTAPVGDRSQWQHDPFAGAIVGDRIYGRGVADSKGAIALFIYLAKALRDSPEFNGSLFLGFDAQEESGSFSGIREILHHAPKADVCILGYQSFDKIAIGARGWLRLKLTTYGKAAHTGSRSKKGRNAVHALIRACSALLTLQLEGQTEPFFEFGSTFNIAQINGGEAINVVPDKAEALIDIRLLPPQQAQSIVQTIEKELRNLQRSDSDFQYALEVLQSEPAYLTDPGHPFVQILQKNAAQYREASGNEIQDLALVANGAGSVGNVVSRLGIPIINAYGCESGNVHAPNEWLNLRTIEPVFQSYWASLVQFCLNGE
ncbi:M20 family metallopeptidase [Pantanalinema sp. GBBB05]|uniref:M20 family metallopeptidase n=1 Tax=Pantanalinema sp. GBBB05 TaxID=2604139 RepID=UPI001D5EA170|nr:M20 family metallopeptidase [Pantanalinema sp. GBBB05]